MAVSYGGQAVLEGVMMRSPSSWAVAIRTPDGDITEVVRDISSPMQRRKIWRLPVIRGVIALGESLAIGFRALAISANVASQERDEDGEIQTQISRGQIIFSFAIAIGFALMLFKIGPALLTSWLPVESTELFVIVEGVIRVSVFIGYILLISLLPDLRRVFQYHGAEHKSINALEAGAELTPANVQKFSLIHPRCGTAFLLWVMVIAIFVFALVGRPDWYWLIASRILLLPVIAGLAYELIRYAGKHQDNRVLMTLLAPGLWLQRLTTREPTDDQVEVSIQALQRVIEKEAAESPEQRKLESRVEVMAVVPPHRPRGRRVAWEGTRVPRSRCRARLTSSGGVRAPGDARLAHRASPRGQDEPRGAPRRGARELLRHLARKRAAPRRGSRRARRRHLHDHDGRGRGEGASHRRFRALRPGRRAGC